MQSSLNDTGTALRTQQKLAGLEDHSRRNILIVFDVPETQNETVEMFKGEVTGNIFENTLGMPVCSVERNQLLGVRVNVKPRPVILKLYHYQERTAVLGKCKKT